MSLFYKISIDRVNTKYISGWCFPRLRPNASLQLQCWCEDKLLAEARADLFREDLVELAIHPTGACGFEFMLPAEFSAAPSTRLVIRIKNSNTTLAVVDPISSRVDYRNLHHKIPGFQPRLKAPTGRCAVFMHIPKTAGTSFNTAAVKMFPQGTVVSHIELIEQDKYRDLAQSCNYISGHLNVGILKQHFQAQNSDFYTIIREPFSQLHSHLKWLVQTATDQRDNYFRINNPIIHALGSRLRSLDLTDAAGLERFVENLSDLEAAFLDNMQTRYFLDHQVARVGRDEQERALENGLGFRLIGTTERYQDFVAVFARLNALPAVEQGSVLNRSSSEDLFDHRSEEIRTILQPLVWADLNLYEQLGDRLSKAEV